MIRPTFSRHINNPRVSLHMNYKEDTTLNISSLETLLNVKVAVNTIVPRSPFFLFLYLKTQTVTHIRKNAVEYLRQWNGAICVIYNLCQRQKIR